MTEHLVAQLRDHDGNEHRDGFLCVRCIAANRIEELTAHGEVPDADDLIERATATLCGWNRCPDCGVLRETIAEIGHLRAELFKFVRFLMSPTVYIHESQTAEVDEALTPYLGVVEP